MKKPYHHGNLRAELLEQARLELEESGVEALSLRRVARRSGVSHTAFAHHFGDARGLLTALTTLGFELLGQALAAAKAAGSTQELPDGVASDLAYVEFAQTHPQLFTLMFASQQPDFSNASLDAASMAAFSIFTEHVRAEVRDAGPETDPVNVPAMANWARVHGLALLLLTGRMRSVLALEPDERREAIIKILRAGEAMDRAI